ncbi:Thioredoxin superfamily protein [Klebsormidium nitens]|uniref:Thioredoxin superfamily protein n=1 Tax=Klebsormidium nitens TaxID=105231 RepID=A0A1Y1IEC8_KLENI|nr:Thioredoxin superfamily protein [Klebsormidium nitens]|eukprot:GAQ86438.1 Thioredoxin superfamily protein [Klebsormidium nitens]
MPWVVHGQAGVAVRWVKNWLSGQWLCDQLGAEGSGCGHTLTPHSAIHQSKQGVSSSQVRQEKRDRKETESVAKPRGGGKSGSRNLLDGKGGVPLMHKTHRLNVMTTVEGQEEGQRMSQNMMNISRFWSQGADLSIAPSVEGSPFSSCASAFQPGGSLHYLKPLFSDIPRRRASESDEGQDCVGNSGRELRDETSDVSNESRHYRGRGRRGVRGAQNSSAFLTVSVRSTEADAESKASPSPQGTSHESLKKQAGRLKPAGAPNGTQQGLLFSAQSKGSIDRKAPATEVPGGRSRDGAGRKAGGAAGPRLRSPQGGVGGPPSGGGPVRGGAVKEKRPFHISNPLELVAGFVEEVRDMVHAATGKKRPPSKESVAAWEEKALAKSLLRKKHASLVMFYSKNCQLCKSMTPMVNDMARKESWWLDVCYVDVDNQSWMPEVVHYDVSYVPCFMYLTPSGMAMAKTGAPLSKTHVLDGLQKVMSGAHPECKLARRRLEEKVRMRQREAYAKARADWEAQKKESEKEGTSEVAVEDKA